MKKTAGRKYEAQAQVMKALAHPSRLLIVNELAKGPMCVSEITNLVGVDTSTVSRHLLLLKNVAIVDTEKQGANVFYSLKMPCALNFFTCMDKVLKTRAREQSAAVR